MARIHDQSLTPNEPNSIFITTLHSSDIQPEKLHIKAEEVIHDDELRVAMTDHRTGEEEDGVKEKEENGRARLVRFRKEVAGRVCIPDMWDQENLLKDWIDCSANLDASLAASSILSARSALVEESRRSRSNSSGRRIPNKCT